MHLGLVFKVFVCNLPFSAILSFPTRYNDLKKGEKLQELQEKHCLAESQLQSCDSRMQEISDELGRSNKLMEDQEQLRRNIDANLNFRRTKAEVEQLTREVESLDAEIATFGGIPKFEAELGKLSQERERLLSEVSIVLHILFSECLAVTA